LVKTNLKLFFIQSVRGAVNNSVASRVDLLLVLFVFLTKYIV